MSLNSRQIQVTVERHARADLGNWRGSAIGLHRELPTEAKTSAAPWLPQTVHFTTDSRTAPVFTKLQR